MKSFWNTKVNQKAIHEIKTLHMQDRNFDRSQRWVVKKDVRKDGVTSNLFPIDLPDSARVHRYELLVSRKERHQPPPTGRVAKANGPVSPNRAWRMFGQLLRKFPTLPPLVRVSSRIYTVTPLSPDMCVLPKEFLDLGWESCQLKLVDSLPISKLPQVEQRQLLNKLLPWSVSYHAAKDGNFSVVRENDGKIVCTEGGISVSGLRIFRGTIASVLFINSDSSTSPSVAKPNALLPSSDVLRSIPLGVYPSTLDVLCADVVRSFSFKGKLVQVYLVQDASGTMSLTLWGFPPDAMKPGSLFSMKDVKCKASATQHIKGVNMELHGTYGVTSVVLKAAGENKVNEGTEFGDNATLALRLDTKCTVASEKSLWEEIKKHFGEGPYDEERQRRITRAVQGTPVVLSTSMRHTTVRVVRYNCSVQDIPLDPQLRQHAASFEPNQPFAVLSDYSVVPLQVLHCCFDPRMRSWTDVTVPACSFLPKRRVDVLGQFCKALSDGFVEWGLHIGNEPWKTKQLAILDSPEKAPRKPQAPAVLTNTNIAPLSSKPRTILMASIAGPRSSPIETEKCLATAQSLARYFKTPHIIENVPEPQALMFVDRVLCPNGELNDPNAVLMIVSSDRQTRAARWLTAECLKRGIMPLGVPGVKGDKRQGLLCENSKLTMMNKFGTDPLRGVDLQKEVPVLKDRRVLVVGVDACHTHDITTGAVVGTLVTPHGNFIVPTFWRNDVRGQEVEQVTDHFGDVIQKALQMAGGLDEVVVFQDGNVFSELEAMKSRVPQGCGMTFMCLHKRTNIRFLHKGKEASNVVKGSVVQSLAPVTQAYEPVAPSFYLQSHDCNMSTARTVQYTVHAVSPTLPVADVQRMSFVLSHVNATMPTKLPISTRCAHKLSSVAERLIDACPDFRGTAVPSPLSQRLWFL